jgi:MFS family permease
MQGFLIPLYLTTLGADVVQVGLVFSVTSIVPLVLPVIGGWFSDSLGRLRTIAIGNLFGILGFVALILASHWEWVILGLSLSGVAWSLQAPSSGAFISEQTIETNRGKVYSLFENSSQVANLIAYPIGGFLAEQFGFRFLLTVAGALYVLVSVIYFWLAARAQSLCESNPGRLSLSTLRGSFGVMLGMIVAGGVFTWIFILDHLNDIFPRFPSPTK